MGAKLTPENITALRQIDTCTIANAIEVFKIRLRNELSLEKLREAVKENRSTFPGPRTTEVKDSARD